MSVNEQNLEASVKGANENDLSIDGEEYYILQILVLLIYNHGVYLNLFYRHKKKKKSSDINFNLSADKRSNYAAV